MNVGAHYSDQMEVLDLQQAHSYKMYSQLS